MKHLDKNSFLFITVGMLSLFCGCSQNGSVVYEEKKPTTQIVSTASLEPTATVTPMPTVTSEPTATVTPIPTVTPEPTATVTSTPTVTPELTVTVTPTPTVTPEPTVTVTPTPTVTPEPTATVTPTPTVTPKLTPTPTPEPVLIIPKTSAATAGALAGMEAGKTKEDFNVNDFFAGAVFSGDSVLSHFYWMVPYYDKETFGGCYFLGKAGYSVREALRVDSEIHPMYQGEQRQIWESMKLIEPAPERILLFFGFNDIGIDGIKGFMGNYDKMINHIREAVPDIKVYIIGLTPMREDMEGKYLNNSIIQEVNSLLQEYCIENNFGYIDVSTALWDEKGALNTEYSDGTNVHLTKSAYLLWKEAMVNYGKEVLLMEYKERMAEEKNKTVER
ncbi:MAG: hypothetical protein J6J44_14400 [Lachnospiraceae bacterium]|nr:hypothetical protein [Lachnospiraceae bacterium]